MIGFDTAISHFFNRAAGVSAGFDQTVVFISNCDLLKGGVVMAFFWGAWFLKKRDLINVRATLLSAFFGALLALVLARILAHSLPLRVRPILDPSFHFRAPSGLPDQANWTGWSSFPSDHAALFAALAAGICYAWRKGGITLVLYTVIVIFLPRLYVGIHFASDLLAGAALGVGSVALLTAQPIQDHLAAPVLRWGERHPAVFYGAFFLMTFEIASVFWDIRTALSLLGFST